MASKKRMSRKELKQVDPLTDKLNRMVKWLEERKTALILGGVLTVVTMGGAGLYQHFKAKSDESYRHKTTAALMGGGQVFAPVGETQAGQEDAKKKLDTLIKSDPNGSVGAIATLIRARIDGESDSATARKAMGTLGSKKAEIKAWTSLNQALALSKTESANAAKELDALALNERNPIVVRVLAKTAVGDIANTSNGGDATAATEAYSEALGLTKTSAELANDIRTRDSLAGQLQIRLASLPPQAQAEPEAEEPEAPAEPANDATE